MAELQQKQKTLVEELLQHLSHLHKSSACEEKTLQAIGVLKKKLYLCRESIDREH